MRELARRWGPALGMMAAIFALSAQTAEDLPSLGAWDLLWTNGGHLTGYALLGAAYLRGMAWTRPAAVRHAAAAIVLAALYGLTDEWHQGFVAGREPSLADLAVDALGAALGVGAVLLLRRRRSSANGARR